MSFGAFQNAWEDACAWDGLRPKVLIPKGKFLVGPLVFKGPCKGREMVVQVKGYVLSQADLNAYKTHDWISFRYINGLLVTGKGLFDGQGAHAWPLNNCLHRRRCKPLPWETNTGGYIFHRFSNGYNRRKIPTRKTARNRRNYRKKDHRKIVGDYRRSNRYFFDSQIVGNY
ncbi:exopolygalacturonase-like [Dendrobium catenatum]|uniref:exopolygalacturonase-like n=1 Tax=Dendrobium catenatum TaxID=906689 RepID=UPI00109F448B|nr:exopolygalacturonase-like [Dendrobium catenatum]